ncbi:hypothetical protein EV652_12815 [Kribbella steppae]|uniref:Uncharacterized protein n=1 Tax=Kribbella steppae TaxID=2512223 RepID=A0A4R2GRU2_9ACTN|nr:hypothetical protein [Kribbella steppae]TCO12844.1 hypothetical protein EV652_12815 [Kribbella steppae]
MFGAPLTPDSIKAETAYRLERTKRAFWFARRRERPEQAGRPQPRRARHALRPTAAP